MTTIELGDIDLELTDLGSGPPLLLVHGFPLNRSMWQEQLAPLAASHRVIAPDLRGFGRSGVSQGTVSMEQFADDLARLLVALGIDRPVTFCGLSMGGYIAWPFFLRHRSRLGKLILCDTRAAPDSPEGAAARLELASKTLAEGPRLLAETMTAKALGETSRRSRPRLVRWIEETILATDPRGAAAALRGMAERIDARSLLSRIDVPTLLICGSEDLISPAREMEQMAAAIPGGTFCEIPSAGHLAPLENPQPVNEAILRFLREETG